MLDIVEKLKGIDVSEVYVSEKEELEGVERAIRLNFSGKKGGISGNRATKGEEWLNIFRW